MLRLHDFYRRYDALPKEERFRCFTTPGQPTSLFVIFQQLTHVRAQKKHYEEREAHLLAQAEEILKKNDGD